MHTAAAPLNPITQVTFTGIQFTPRQNYYQTFQSGTSAKLAVSFAYRYQTAACASASLAPHVCVHNLLDNMHEKAAALWRPHSL